jgi:CMP-N-acetylneuraminic acid synthetase
VRAGKRIIAIVPARSGSKGIPDKNMRRIGGKTLIARAGDVLNSPACEAIDLRLLSTDSERYAEEGRRHGLESPFLRSAALSQDNTGAIETMQHVWRQAEAHYGVEYDLLLIVEPTCPLRRPADVANALDLFFEREPDSVVTVSRVDTKFHPHKVLRVNGGLVSYYDEQGAQVQTRQSLEPLYFRNGACYVISKSCLYEKNAIFTENTCASLIERPLANIDEPIDLVFAEFLDRQPGD